MDGIHDMGGMQGFGAVPRETDEPVFHSRWEAQVFGLLESAGASGLTRNVDAFRHAIERLPPLDYLADGYYGRWLACLETLLMEQGLITREEYAARLRANGCTRAPARASPPDPPWSAATGQSEQDAAGPQRDLAVTPQFSIGERVRVRDLHYRGHTRLPGYVRGRRGMIVAQLGGWVYPDTHAHGMGASPRHLYTVRFEAGELWTNDAEARTCMHVDLFEPYLEPSRDEW